MTTTAPNSTAVTGGIKTSAPRIISPEIKVIYPSDTLKDQVVSEVQTTAPTPQVLPLANEPTTVPTKEGTVVTPTGTTPSTTAPATVETPKKTTWTNTLKEHAGLFIAVALISIGIGVLIGKKL
ncbi:hypothetical protein D3C71_563890 [compost metagenome]